MSLQLAAQHLSNHGRGRDSMLVHMSPREVKGLNDLAMAHGGQLSINPSTGLPEAGFLESILPMVAGAALVASGVGAPYAALMVGGGTAVLTGSLKKGLMAGLGAYGGANLGAGLGETAVTMDPSVVSAQNAVVENATKNLYDPTGTLSPADYSSQFGATSEGLATKLIDARAAATPTDFMGRLQGIGKGISSLGQEGGFSSLYQNLGGSPMSLLKTIGPAVAPLAGELMKPEKQEETKGDSDMGQRYGFSMNPTGGQPQVQPGQDPISNTPTPTTTPFPTPDIYGKEQRYFSPRYSKITPEEAKKLYGYAVGGNVELRGKVTMDDQGGGQFGQTGFGQQGANGYQPAGNGFTGNNNSAPQNQQNQFGGLDPQANPQGFLNSMQGAQQRERQMSGSTFLGQIPKRSYEDYVNGPTPDVVGYKPMTREEFDKDQTRIEQQQKAGYFGLGSPQVGGGFGGLSSLFGGELTPTRSNMISDAQYRPKRDNARIAANQMNQQQFSSFAEGGIADEDRPTETPALQAFKQMQAQRAEQTVAPIINANAEFAKYAQQTVGAPNQLQAPTMPAPTMPAPTSTNLSDSGFSYDPIKQQYNQITGSAPTDSADPATNPFSIENRPVIGYSSTGEKMYGEVPKRIGMGGIPIYAAGGGISHLGDYSDGGRLLRGPGDGVSDSIPAMIGKRQPARLADGEFVVPARIVSELGNGSTEAGARKLYAMMDRIQKARGKTVGKNKVAKNSRSEKYLPA